MTKSNQSIEKLLESLPEEEKLILNLYYKAEKSPAQIADLIGVPEMVVTRMVSASKLKLIQLLQLDEK